MPQKVNNTAAGICLSSCLFEAQVSESTVVHSRMHVHDHYEFLIHQGGEKYLAYGEKVCDLTPGRLYVFPPFLPHGLFSRGKKATENCACLHLSREMMQRVGFGAIDLDGILQDRLNTRGSQFFLKSDEAEVCRGLFAQLQDLMDSPDPQAAFGSHVLTAAFMNLVLKACDREPPAENEHGGTKAYLDAVRYIGRHYTQPLSLAQIAGALDITPASLSSGFMRCARRSVYDYILLLRAALALRLIKEGMPFGDISEQCGFSDYSSFLRMFRVQVGMSPRTYGKMIRAPE